MNLPKAPRTRAHLSVVPKTAPTRSERVTLRIKRSVRPDGMLQCNRCGGRTMATIINGAFLRKGRVQGGTVIVKYHCVECWKRGLFAPMLPELKPIR